MAADERYYRKFPTPDKLFKPEIEYIDYDVEKLGHAGSFAIHVDNKSVITIVCMLQRPGN